ncbi:tetratricopeptide repeat protein [Haliangium sp.]|uniref:tetratricopeptide repeat protein n=1 Tax=Haliangium sp. TaxID=2663208 RepID=UPI003D12DD51
MHDHDDSSTALIRATDAVSVPAVPRADEPSWKLARSLDEARVGEVMMLDQHGNVLSPRRIRWIWARSWLTAGAMGAALGLSSSVLLGSLGVGVGVVGVYFGAFLWQLRHRSTLRRVLALCAAGRRDEAQAALSALEAQKLPPHYRPILDMLSGNLAFLRGEFDEALTRYERVIERHRPSGRGPTHPIYWICAFNRVQLLASAGRLERARELRPELDEAPRGAYFEMDRMLTELLLAFHAGEPDELEGDLYEWAKAALKTNRFGLNVVLLAWAFHACGDDDMARIMLREAPQRLTGHFLADSAPRVHAWMMAKRAEWKIDEAGELYDDFPYDDVPLPA